MSTIDEVKSRIDIVDLVSEAGVKLRKAGRNYTGFCPFHDNKRTPAFVVWPETGTWKCFGQCNEGGDIFKFVMKKNGWDFKEALQRLADRAGVELQEYTPQQEAQKEVYDTLRSLLDEAVLYYRNHLLQNADVLDYLHEKRGLTDATIETFGLGYAPQGWDNALKHFTERGYAEQDLFDAGLLSERDSGGYYDRFRHRLMIPIRDERGRMAGFGARALDDDQMPKYLNSPQTALFDKGRLLYGLDRARKPIRAADQVVIVEGYLDVIAPHQAGFENVVSPMGTALTEDQLRLLKRFTRKIVLALDPDAAGQKAILRGLDAARSAMDREGELRFDARGLLRNEARLQADLRVASLPDELDPDEIVARDPEEWSRLIESAKPIVTHVMETLAEGQNLGDPKVKSNIAAQVVPLIEDLPNPVERETYRQQLARFLKVDERSLIGRQVQPPRKRRPRRRPGTDEEQVEVQVIKTVRPSYHTEIYCLGVLFRKPELLNRLDRQLQEAGLQRLIDEDFGYTDHQMLLDLVRQSLEQDKLDHYQYVVEHLPETLKELAGELLKQTEKLDPIEERLLEELQRSIIKLRRMGLNESLNQLSYMFKEAQEQGDLRATAYQEQVLQHTRLLRDLDHAGRKLSLRRIE
ncbi:MAG: DNA primase [Anaerolineales bacterium]|jgi:DNA primase